jgi:exonuclease III
LTLYPLLNELSTTRVMFNQNCSIVFLQETHFNNESKCFIEEQSDYQCLCSHGNNSSRGVAILLRNQLDYEKYLQTQFSYFHIMTNFGHGYILILTFIFTMYTLQILLTLHIMY